MPLPDDCGGRRPGRAAPDSAHMGPMTTATETPSVKHTDPLSTEDTCDRVRDLMKDDT